MNKTLSPAEVTELLHAVPLPPRTLTRHEKLSVWANAVRNHPFQLDMLHGIEHMHPSNYYLISTNGTTIFDVATKNPALNAAGLTTNNVGDSVKFFELSPNELHHLSCDCHGAVTNEHVASRIDYLAKTTTVSRD